MKPDDQFLTFSKFEEKDNALDFAELLKMNNIDYLLEDLDIAFDPIFSSNKLSNEFRVKIQKQDFEKAEALLTETPVIKENEDIPATEYYLFSFTDDELLDLVAKRDEWSNHDYKLALYILKERGNEPDDNEIDNLKAKRLAELAQPESHHKAWVYIGYLLAIAGGFAGILIGWHLLTSRKTLPDGKQLFAFTPAGRKHGRIILILGIVSFLLFSANKIIYH